MMQNRSQYVLLTDLLTYFFYSGEVLSKTDFVILRNKESVTFREKLTYVEYVEAIQKASNTTAKHEVDDYIYF